MISLETALEIIDASQPANRLENFAIEDACARVLSADIKANYSLPPNDMSAMDGYALAGAGPNFALKGVSAAGAPFSERLATGEAARIFTGGVVPHGADRVLIQENAHIDGKTVTATSLPESGRHIRRAGQDFTAGDIIAKAGTRLTPYHCALIAAAGHGSVSLHPRPLVAFLPNGDELVLPGTKPEAGQIISSNPFGLAPLARQWGADAKILPITPDDPKEITRQIQAAAAADIVVPIGGASVGDHDYMQSTFAELGFKSKFSKVAVKPGKPVWFGKLKRQYVLGLPGNPASALVCAHIFLKPLIDRLSGSLEISNIRTNARTAIALGKSGPRTEFIRAGATVDESGAIHVRPFPRQDSALISPFTRSNCLLVREPFAAARPADADVEIIQTGRLLPEHQD